MAKIKRVLSTIIFLFSFFGLTNISAGELTDLSIGAGFINQFIGKFQTTREGDENSFEPRLYLETSVTYDLDTMLTFTPEAALVWPGGGEEEYISRYVYYFNFLVGWRPVEYWSFKVGPGFYFTTISGDGGTDDLPNGIGIDSFPVPDGPSTSRNLTGNLAVEYYYWPLDISIKAETLFFNPFDSVRRAYSYTLSLHYHFRDRLWTN
jgi:hypothetical protein